MEPLAYQPSERFMAKADLTAERLRELLSYDPETGVFTRLVNFGKKTRYSAGTVAGFVMQSTGYCAISIQNKHYLSHRLAWLYMTGNWPDAQVDHIDRCRTNNRWANLRSATNKQNSENISMRSNNTSGAAGVYFNKMRNKWTARLNHNGKTHCYGNYERFEDAVKARARAVAEHFTHSTDVRHPR